MTSQLRKKRIVLYSLCWLVAMPLLLEALLSSRIPWKMAFLEPYIIGHTLDGWTNAAFEIEKIKRKKYDKHYVFLGGSIGLAAITDDDILSTALNNNSDKKIVFSSINSSNKTLTDEAKIINELGNFGGTIIIPIELITLTKTIEVQYTKFIKETNSIRTKYYHLKTPDNINKIIKQYGGNLPFKEKTYIFRTLKVFGENLRRRIALIVNKRKLILKLNLDRTVANEGEPVDDEFFKETSEMLKGKFSAYDKNKQFNLDLLQEIITMAKKNNNKVILLEFPINELYDKLYKDAQKDYSEVISNLVEANNITYLDLSKEPIFNKEDYRDTHHMRTVGAEKFSKLLASKLTEGNF